MPPPAPPPVEEELTCPLVPRLIAAGAIIAMLPPLVLPWLLTVRLLAPAAAWIWAPPPPAARIMLPPAPALLAELMLPPSVRLPPRAAAPMSAPGLAIAPRVRLPLVVSICTPAPWAATAPASDDWLKMTAPPTVPPRDRPAAVNDEPGATGAALK